MATKGLSAGHSVVRDWIAEIILANPAPISIALRQRAKFEGWLKFELASQARRSEASNVTVEAAFDTTNSQYRSDVAFAWNDTDYAVELKTVNTNWRMPGVDNKTRPITKNIAGIIADARKLEMAAAEGLVAFVIFPIPRDDQRWHQYLEQIGQGLGEVLSPDSFATQLTAPVFDKNSVDVVVCCFPIAT